MVAQQRPSASGESGRDTSTWPTAPRTIWKDDAFHILQSGRRRAVLRHMLSCEGRDRFEVDDLANAVTAWEHDAAPARPETEDREWIAVELYHSHLPELDEHGIVDYDRDRGLVVPTRLLSVFEPYLELDADRDPLVVDESADDDAGLTDTVRTLFRIDRSVD